MFPVIGGPCGAGNPFRASHMPGKRFTTEPRTPSKTFVLIINYPMVSILLEIDIFASEARDKVVKVLALHIVDPASVPGTLYGPLIPA